MLNWAEIDTVLLDMDGTLLDLHFDNYFWQTHLPQRYAEHHGLAFESARAHLMSRFKEKLGTLEWYCIDYWTEQLGVDVAALKEEVAHLIQLRADVINFLDWLHKLQKRVILVTNAHPKTINLKMRFIPLYNHFDRIFTSHDIGVPKEEHTFWQNLQQHEAFIPTRTLLVDDSIPVLQSAVHYGIAYILEILQPDTHLPPKTIQDFPAIHHFREIME